MTPHKLGLVVSILPPVESIIHAHFRWQSEETWVSEAIENTPLVVMANMSKSPAAIAMNKLVMMMLGQDSDPCPINEPEAQGLPTYLRIFTYLDKGQVWY